MKKRKRMIILIIISVLLYIIIVKIDYTLSKVNSSPIFAIPLIKYRDGGTIKYYGLGYIVIKYNTIGGRNDTVFKFWFIK